MRGPAWARRGGASLILLLAGAACPATVVAQAWVMPRGEGAVTVTHQFADSTDHIDRYGVRDPNLGRETLHIAVTDVVYGATERFSIEGSLVGLATRWVGAASDRHGPLDTGAFNASVQDIRVGLRYQLVEGAINVAPFAAFGGPTTDYETRGHSAFGRHMEELTLGAAVGGQVLGRAYWQVLGSYAVVNDIDSEDFDLDHLNGDAEIGLALGPRLTLRAFGSSQWMWDGLEVGPLTDHFHLRTNHDRFTQSSFVNVGGGIGVSLSPRFDLGVSGFATVTGRNFHALNALVTSLTWKFGGGFRIAPAVPDVPTR